MKISNFFCALLAVLGAGFAFSEPTNLAFKKKSAIVSHYAHDKLVLGLPVESVLVFEPHMGENKTYRGVNFQKLLSKVYGSEWHKFEEILFTCQDGYQPSIPVAKVKNNTAYLVFAQPGGSFKIDNKLQNKTNVLLAPYYLVWENIKNTAIRADGVGDWPYQVVAIDLINFVDKFPHIAPPPKSNSSVVNGFLAFRKHCIRCHSINGEGGAFGAELNYPANVTEYWKEDWLVKWIVDPSSVRHKPTMPGLKNVDATPQKTSKEIVSYLKVMAKHKKKP